MANELLHSIARQTERSTEAGFPEECPLTMYAPADGSENSLSKVERKAQVAGIKLIARLAIAENAATLIETGAMRDLNLAQVENSLKQRLRTNNNLGKAHWEKHIAQGLAAADFEFWGRRGVMPLTLDAMREFEESDASVQMQRGNLPKSLVGKVG